MEYTIEEIIGESLISSDARNCLENAIAYYNGDTDFTENNISLTEYEYGETLVDVLEYGLSDKETTLPYVYSHTRKVETFNLDVLDVPSSDEWVQMIKKTGGQIVIEWYEAAKERVDGYTVWNPGESLCNILLAADGTVSIEESDSGDVKFQLSSDTKVPIVKHRNEVYSVIENSQHDDENEVNILQYDNNGTSLFVDVKEDNIHDFPNDGFRSVTEPVREIISAIFAPQREIASRFIGYYHDESEVFTPEFNYWKTLLAVSAGQIAIGLYYTDAKDKILSHIIFRSDMIEITVDDPDSDDVDYSCLYNTVTINDVQETPENEVENILSEREFTSACAIHVRQIENLNNDITILNYE